MVSEELASVLSVLVFPGLTFLLTLALLSEWMDRKIVARLQNRVGPLHTGPWGLLQPFADLLKLLSKEDITPLAANSSLFSMTPILILTFSLLPLFTVPISGPYALTWFEGDLLLVMFLTTLISLTAFLAAFSSTNRFSTTGGVRLALQMLGYEVPLTIALICPAISAHSLSISVIVQSQAESPWYLLTQPLGFVTTIACFLAELHFVPFDVPEAETELVAGWLVEFSGKKLALLRLAQDLKLALAASLTASLYLGGTAGPPVLHPALVFLLKFTSCILIFSNLRALFARYRIDQVLQGAWKYLTPAALLQAALVQSVSVVIT